MATKKYWDQRYNKDGISGRGSRGAEREWRWDLINNYIPSIDQVIDVGCGDLEFWKGKDCIDYTGIDFSEVIIQKNKEKRPDWKFINAPAEEYIEGIKAECVLCLGVLFHIMDDDAYQKILENLCKYSTKYIVIYTWVENPFSRINAFKRNKIRYVIFPSNTDGRYQYFRSLDDSLHLLDNHGFELINMTQMPNKIGGFYFYARSIEN